MHQGTQAEFRLCKDGAGYGCDYISKGHPIVQLCMHLVSSGIKLNEYANFFFVWYCKRENCSSLELLFYLNVSELLLERQGEKQSITY